jgi:nucleotide-binding universal stress UspA family protein
VHGILDAIAEDGIDLVVMATHARSALEELARGTVAGDVVRAGVVPVTLVHDNGHSHRARSARSRAAAAREPRH